MIRKTHKLSRSHTHQSGLTLVEMMVAITISLILMAGVTQIFLGSKSSHTTQNGLVQLQENARFALDALATSIEMAGYTSNSANTLSTPKYNVAGTLNDAATNAFAGLTVTAGTDTIEINYESATDCLGNSTGVNGIATNRYYVSGGNLMCLGNGSATPGIIAQGIDDMQILYGNDTDPDDAAHIANQYINAATLPDPTTTAGKNSIVSARIALLLSTIDPVVQGTAAKSYSLLDAAPVSFADAQGNDNRLRRVFTRTILMRNVK